MNDPMVFIPEPVEEPPVTLWTWIASRRLSSDDDRNECIKSIRVLMSGNFDPRKWERQLGICHPMRRELSRLRLAFNVATRNTGMPEKL